MLNDYEAHKLEQAIAQAGEIFPRTWREVFNGCKREGFTEAESMDLLKTYIMSQNPHGIQPK